MSKRKQLFAAALIVLAGAAVSAVILFGPLRNAPAEPETAASAAPAADTAGHAVRFYGVDGAVLDSASAADGAAVLPPAIRTPAGQVFRSWSEDLFAVTQDLDVFPVFEDEPETENAVFADSVYADIAGDISVLLKLGGKVGCCDFRLDIQYDGDLLQYASCEPLTDGVQAETGEKAGSLSLRYSGSSLNAPTELARLHFSSDKSGQYKTNLAAVMSEIHKLKNGTAVYADSTVYNVEIFLTDGRK